jgi:hypothetical protein
MPRHITVSLALILGLAVALNTAPLLAVQEEEVVPCDPENPTVTVGEQTFIQDCTNRDEFSLGLVVDAGPAGGSLEAERLYAVQFTGVSGNEPGAYIPERFNRQAMVVRVLAGNFAFRTQGPGVIVDAQGQPLEKYIANPPIGLGQNPNVQGGRVFDDGDGSGEQFSCALVLAEQVLCELNPREFEAGDAFVRLDPGDTVYLPDNSTCFVCNTVQIDSAPAKLLIWTPATGFNGDLNDAANAMAAPPQDKSLSTQGSGSIVGWMFNPGGRCN